MKFLDGSRARPYDTVEPLAQDLGLTVDTSCDRDDQECVSDLVNAYMGSGNILICWEHGQLTNIVDALGDDNAPTYPDARSSFPTQRSTCDTNQSYSFNIIWTDPSPYDSIVSMTSENCPGLDS
jgi:hypothetical protein